MPRPRAIAAPAARRAFTAKTRAATRVSRGERSRIPQLDLLRLLAAAGIIAVHVLAWAGRTTDESIHWYRSLDLLLRLSLPAFILLSGAALGHSRRDAPLQVGRFLRGRLMRLLVPWAFWASVWMIVQEARNETPLDTPVQALTALAQGPGYLYFLLLLAQFAVLFAFLPQSARGRAIAAGLAVTAQAVFATGRLFLPTETPVVLEQLAVTHSYEFFLSWVGLFCLGVWAGGRIDSLLWPSKRALAVTAGTALILAPVLLMAPELGLWQSRALDGANVGVHPLYLPLSVSATLLLLWTCSATLRLIPRATSVAQRAGIATMGAYLIHQYPLDVLGPWLQSTQVSWLWISAPLPDSFLAVGALYAATVVTTVTLLLLLYRLRPARMVLGG